MVNDALFCFHSNIPTLISVLLVRWFFMVSMCCFSSFSKLDAVQQRQLLRWSDRGSWQVKLLPVLLLTDFAVKVAVKACLKNYFEYFSVSDQDWDLGVEKIPKIGNKFPWGNTLSLEYKTFAWSQWTRRLKPLGDVHCLIFSQLETTCRGFCPRVVLSVAAADEGNYPPISSGRPLIFSAAGWWMLLIVFYEAIIDICQVAGLNLLQVLEFN